MATQKEAMLQVVDSVIDFVQQFELPTKKHEKAVDQFLRQLAKKRLTLLKQIDVYKAQRKKGR